MRDDSALNEDDEGIRAFETVKEIGERTPTLSQ